MVGVFLKFIWGLGRIGSSLESKNSTSGRYITNKELETSEGKYFALADLSVFV